MIYSRPKEVTDKMQFPLPRSLFCLGNSWELLALSVHLYLPKHVRFPRLYVVYNILTDRVVSTASANGGPTDQLPPFSRFPNTLGSHAISSQDVRSWPCIPCSSIFFHLQQGKATMCSSLRTVSFRHGQIIVLVSRNGVLMKTIVVQV